MAEATEDSWKIEKLDGSNWLTWKFQMRHLLLAKGLWGYVDGSEKLEDTASALQKKEFNKKSQMAFSTIVMAVSSSQLYLITSCERPNDAWGALKTQFERDSLANKILMKKTYFRMEMEEGMLVSDHLKKMKEITDRLAAIGAPISEEDQVVTLLGSLPESYSTLVTALEARGESLKLGYVQEALIHEEQKRNSTFGQMKCREREFPENALVGGAPRKSKALNKSLKCYGCGETGHFRRNCARYKYPKSRSNHEVKMVESQQDNDSSDDTFAAFMELPSSKEKWLLDSGASSHMTRNRDLFIEYEDLKTSENVGVGDGRVLTAVGIGSIKLDMILLPGDLNTVTLTNVLYVPDLACNLFSVSTVANKGYSV